MKKDVLKIILFLLFIRISILVLLTIMAMTVFLFLYFIDWFSALYQTDNYIFEILYKSLATIFAIFAMISVMYIPAKIFGIFEIMEKYGFKVELAMLIVLSILVYLILKYTGIPKESLDDYFSNTYLTTNFIYAWLFRKFFNFLTKKFPTPFKQIGYFFSLEFYKDLFKKIIKN